MEGDQENGDLVHKIYTHESRTPPPFLKNKFIY